MAPSKRHVFTAFSAIYLIALTCLAIYALHKMRALHLPIPTVLGAFTLVLPAITGLVLETLTSSANSTDQSGKAVVKWSPKFGTRASLSQYAIPLLFVYETVLATLAGTYLAPVSGLRCGLDERWRDLYKAKNEKAIRRIQDAFNCCGLHSRVDMAYPFPSKERLADACLKMYERKSNCFEAWRGEERGMAGLILAITAGVAVWKVSVLLHLAR
jgi:hypothetical protein